MKPHLVQRFLAAAFFLLSHSLLSQSIQWSHLLLPGDVNIVAKDSSEKTMAIFKSRLFLYDSLQRISRETGVPFFEYDYIAEFKKPQEVYHLVLNFRGASRLMYYIRLFDEQGDAHVVYNYGAIHPCDPGVQTLVLTIAHTPYKVRKVEVGTFVGKDDLLGIGLSGEPDGNKVLQELVAQRNTSLCSKASYFTEKIALTEEVNSESAEVKPIISPDGKTLYFHRQNHKQNMGGRKDDQDIYRSRLAGDGWSPAENIGGPLNDNMPNGIASVSSGETMLFLINEYIAPNQQRQGLSWSEKTINGWSFPKSLNVTNFYNRSEYMDFFISPTQNEMILAIQRDDSYGDQDLYISFFDDATGVWTEPVNLGPDVNTMLSEASPFLAADGKTLYFASNGILGYGGFDIFVTHRLDDSWTRWSYPENLGPVINTFDDDLYYTLSAAGDQAYFVSTENRDRNIFRIPLPAIYKPEPVVLLSGKIFNQSTAVPQEAEVKVRWHNDTEVIGSGKSDPLTGEYKLILPAGGIYDYTVSKDGFTDVAGTISTLKTRNYEEKEQHILLREDVADARPVIFLPLPPTLAAGEWKDQIAKAAVFLEALPHFYATVEGSWSSPQNLPEIKAMDDLKKYMVRAGIKPAQIRETLLGGEQLTLVLRTDSLVFLDEAISIPEGYVRPDKSGSNDISLLIKGKVIDAITLKPVAGRMLFRLNDKVRSRSTSDPATGNYQTLLPANTSYNVMIYADSTEYTHEFKTPVTNQYQEIAHTVLVNADHVTSTRVEIGSGISQNRDSRSVTRWQRTLKKKRFSRQVLNLADDKGSIAPRFQADMDYIAEILTAAPEAKAVVISHTSRKPAKIDLQDNIAQRIVKYFHQKGIESSRLEFRPAGFSEPRHKNPRHHSNNRIELEIHFNGLSTN